MKNINLKTELIEAYKTMGKRDLMLLKEWEYTSHKTKIIIKTANYKNNIINETGR